MYLYYDCLFAGIGLLGVQCLSRDSEVLIQTRQGGVAGNNRVLLVLQIHSIGAELPVQSFICRFSEGSIVR